MTDTLILSGKVPGIIGGPFSNAVEGHRPVIKGPHKTPGLHLEQSLWQQGIQFIAGIDEAGRGAWAGPVMAAVVVLPNDPRIGATLNGVRDSKQMTLRQRERWAVEIKSAALAWCVGLVSAAEIDAIGILPATRTAMTRAIQGLAFRPEHFLFDFIHWKDCPYPGEKLVKGESQSLSIAAASVLAKTTRDDMMRELDREYSVYGFARHKGYGTKIHQEAIRKFGLCLIHRKSYRIGNRKIENRE